MHLAILMTNTDESPFAHRHPKDGEKFTSMLRSVRPDWETSVFSVKDGQFPKDLRNFDGALITGSPASVHDEDPWVPRLIDFLRDAIEKEVPLFGACFGHQAIAMALGERIIENSSGWVFGRTDMKIEARPDWARDLPPSIGQYAAHIEQVENLPEGSVLLLSSPECPVGGFAMGSNIATTQNHPEMTYSFISALVEEYADKLPREAVERARASLDHPVEATAYTESIARFFEAAQRTVA